MQRIHSIGLGTPGLRMSPRRCCCFAVSRLFSELCVTLSGAYRYLAVPRKGQERACLRTALRSCHASVGPPRPTPTFLPRRACPNPAGQIPDAGTRQSLCSTRQAIFGLPKFAIAALWVARRASASPRTSNPLEPHPIPASQPLALRRDLLNPRRRILASFPWDLARPAFFPVGSSTSTLDAIRPTDRRFCKILHMMAPPSRAAKTAFGRQRPQATMCNLDRASFQVCVRSICRACPEYQMDHSAPYCGPHEWPDLALLVHLAAVWRQTISRCLDWDCISNFWSLSRGHFTSATYPSLG
jgi:hypothetical protein